jgi:hypothetical protein
VFSITLDDANGRSRTFWSLEANGSSATTSWKRFAANLTDYTSETVGFNISAVESVDLYVNSNAKKSMTFWVDDLTVDTALNLTNYVYKGRVPVDEAVVAYFYTSIGDPQLASAACARNRVDSGVIADTSFNVNVHVYDKHKLSKRVSNSIFLHNR